MFGLIDDLLLFFVLALLEGLFLLFLAHRLLKAASVLGNLAKGDVDDRVGDPFQEVVVVGNDHRRPGEVV